MGMHQIAVVTDRALEQCNFLDQTVFDGVCTEDPDQLPMLIDENRDGLILVAIHPFDEAQRDSLYQRTLDIGRELGKPVVVIRERLSVAQKLRALESGFSDVIPLGETVDEVTARLLREIYHSIANRQLKQRLNSASDAALAAMRESSNLGCNVHFLVQAHQCNNLDELGQLFFHTLKNYALNCSLQMRSEFETKNMEINGMARQLESELLTQLKGAGRYFDFGRRTVMNYGTVSVLVRNMPEDPMLYGLAKDNTFTLLQGLDARVRALDSQRHLLEQKEALLSLSSRLNSVIQSVNEEYQTVMRGIVDVVENMAESINNRIPLLLLNEEQEAFIEETVRECVHGAHHAFTKGFKVDSHFQALQQEISKAVEKVEESERNAKEMTEVVDAVNDAANDIELF